MKTKLLITFYLISLNLLAQFTVKGRVVDENKHPLPFVNAFIKGTTYGTTTDEDGRFAFICHKRRGELNISSMGFQTQTFDVNAHTKYLNIVLKEGTDVLEEIIVVTRPKKRLKKEENPAYRILKEFWKRKHKLGVELTDTYSYKKHTTTEIGLNNIDSVFIKTLFNEQYDEVMKEIHFDSDGINYYMPVYMQEQVSKVYGNNKIGKKRVDIEAERKEGFRANGFIFDRMGTTFNNIDVFKNNIPLLKKSFVSPFSSTGFATYDYVLYDSINKGGKKLYDIYFFPRREADFAFQGHFLIADKDFSVKKVTMKVTKDSGINFVRALSFEKHFKVERDSVYLPTKSIYDADFTLLDKSDNQKGMTIRQTDVFSEYNFTKKYPNNFYEITSKKLYPNQYKKDKDYWISYENNQNKESYKLLKSVKNKRKVKNITEAVNVISTGYIKMTKSPLELGNLWSILTYNQVEGLRTKLSLRTFKTKDDRFKFRGYLAYGFKDKKIKYGLETKYLLSYQPRIAVGLAYQDDVEQLGSVLMNTTKLLGRSFGTSAILSRGNNYFLSNVKRYLSTINYAVTDNFRFGLTLSRSEMYSATTDDNFSVKYLNDNGTINSQVTDVASDFYISFTPNRMVYGLGVEQRAGEELYPSFILNFRSGYKGIFGGTHNYNKIQFQYNHPIMLGEYGILKTNLELGKTFGKVPLLLLSPIPANQAYSLVKNTFALMNYYDYITDEYASLHLEQHFNGFIFNRIPLINKLKWRSLATFRIVYGSISKQNIEINKSNISYNAPTDKPYYEYGFGIENIGYGNIRFFRIDAIWRSDYTPSLNNVATPTQKFGIRIGLQTDL